MARVDRALPRSIGVVCLDQEVVEYLRSCGAPPCYLLKGLERDLLEANSAGAAMRDLWAVRVLEAERLLEAGYGAIFFDADGTFCKTTAHARKRSSIRPPIHPPSRPPRPPNPPLQAIWQTDVVKLLSGGFGGVESQIDVVASRGRFPHNIEKVWGATLCMGLIYFAPTPGARALLAAMRHYISADPSEPFDDQVCLLVG